MPSEVLSVPFPNGSKEYWLPSKMLEVDDVIWHDGVRYRVVSVSADGGTPRAVVEPASPSVGDLLQSEAGALRLALR
jgi:hypothetical protein